MHCTLGALTQWRICATRADVHVHHGSALSSGQSRSWLSWFCFDGGDTNDALRSFCEAAQLNSALRDLLADTDVLDFDGPRRPVRFCLTGDGKVMRSSHHGTGLQCWLCDESVTSLAGLVPNPSFPTHLRSGALFDCIPIAHRVGDYVHCGCRVVNLLLARLQAVSMPMRRAVRQVAGTVKARAEGRATEGSQLGVETLDIAACTLLLTTPELQQLLVDKVQPHSPAELLRCRHPLTYEGMADGGGGGGRGEGPPGGGGRNGPTLGKGSPGTGGGGKGWPVIWGGASHAGS